MIITQTEETLAWCRRKADAVVANLPARSNYTTLEAPQRYYIGYRGELATCTWLKRSGVRFTYHVCTDGASQEPEIDLHFGGNTHRCEVKTAGKRRRDFMMSAKQRTDFDIVVGLRVHTETDIEVCGWLHALDIPGMNIEMTQIESRVMPYSNMRPLRSFLRIVARAEHGAWLDEYDS